MLVFEGNTKTNTSSLVLAEDMMKMRLPMKKGNQYQCTVKSEGEIKCSRNSEAGLTSRGPRKEWALEMGLAGGAEFQKVDVEPFLDWVINSSHFLSTWFIEYTR